MLFIHINGADIPIWDEWEFVRLLSQLHSGTLTLPDIVRHHNEHPILVPRLFAIVYLWIARDYHSLPFMFGVWVQLCVLLFLTYNVLRDQFKFTTATVPLWLAPIPCLTFSWRQSDNLLWGFQFVFIMPLLWSVLCFYFLHKDSVPTGTQSSKLRTDTFTLALIAATAASFSGAMGLMAWPAGLVAIAISGAVSVRSPKILLWTASGFGCVAAYLINFHHVVRAQEKIFTLSEAILSTNVLHRSEYFLCVVGSALFREKLHACVGGFIIVALFGYCLFALVREGRCRAYSFWITLGIYSALALFSIAVGRSHFGAEQATVGRYSSHGIPLVIATYTITVTRGLVYGNIRSSVISGLFLCVILFGGIQAGLTEWRLARVQKLHRERLVEVLRNYRNATDEELIDLHPSPEFLRSNAEFLERYHLGCFRR